MPARSQSGGAASGQRPPASSEAPGTALAALTLGAVAMGISPVFVRLAEVGPFASAFWRVGLALPLLWAWAAIEARRAGEPATIVWRIDRPIFLAGLAFTFDLILWHVAILNTTIANATFLATLAPVWVALGSGLLLREPVGRQVAAGLALCMGGAVALIGTSYGVAPGHLTGDLFGFATSLFFGLYILAVRAAGRRGRPGRTTFLASLVTAAALLAVALAVEGRMLPLGPRGAVALAGLAIVSHVGGQGLLAFALRHQPAAFSALVIFLEAIAAATFGWLFLSEPISLLQAGGGALILLGIAVARPRRARRPNTAKRPAA